MTTVLEPRSVQDHLMVLPNPAWDSVTLRRSAADENARIDIVNTEGQRVFSAIFLEGETDLSMSIKGWPAGAYTVRLLSESVITAAPLVLAP